MRHWIWHRTVGNDFPSEGTWEWFRVLIALSALSLLGLTWRLWWTSDDFPQTPWIEWGCDIPLHVDRVLLLVLTIDLAVVLVTISRLSRVDWGLSTFPIAALGLMTLNQQRTQPWMYQLVLIAIVLATTPRTTACGLLRLLTVGIYFHSGLSKLDVSFCSGLGALFWRIGQTFVFGGAVPGAPQFSLWPLLFPVTEIVIAVGLLWPQTRRMALWAACGMHGVLILLLSPWGLNHRPAVLLWNLFFILQDLILFAHAAVNNPETVATTASSTPQPSSIQVINPNPPSNPPARIKRVAAVQALIAWVLIWPFAEPWGGCDAWLAWGLYAEHGEQLTIIVSQSGWEKLPPKWRAAATPILKERELESPPAPESPSVQTFVQEWRLRIKNVSLEQLAVPVYPANRFLLGVALQIATEARLQNNEMSAIWESPANRWTGVRESRKLENLETLHQAAEQCWFNAKPRQQKHNQ